MAPLEPLADLRTLLGLYDSIDQLLGLDRRQLRNGVAAISAWSPDQHLAHVALANELVLRNIASLASGRGSLIVRGGATDPRTHVLLEEGRLPRGQAQSPRMVRPPERVERELLQQWLADGRAALTRLLLLDARALVASELRIPHQLLGPLDAPQWARFGVVHTQHHIEIVREILEGSKTR